jgi:hypothetical protein
LDVISTKNSFKKQLMPLSPRVLLLLVMNMVCSSSSLSCISTNCICFRFWFAVNLDDCWQVSRDADGTIQADPTDFPSGIAALADYVHSRKLKFGLYSGTTISTIYQSSDLTLYYIFLYIRRGIQNVLRSTCFIAL